MKDVLNKAIASGHGDALVYAGAIGLILSDIIPTPADAVYFKLMQSNKEKLESGQISAKQYWQREALLYYGLNPLWWSLVLGALYFTKGHYTTKMKVGLAVIAAGGVFAVLNENIRKDQKRNSK